MTAFEAAVRKILFSEDDFSLIKEGIDFLHLLFAKHAGVQASDLTNDNPLETENGVAIGTVHAAHCLLDIARTTHFLRGIYKAIMDRADKGHKVRILYAGCGPYATLVTPMTALFSSHQISFALLEINPTSATAVKKLCKGLSITRYIDNLIIADATDPAIAFDNTFDIIISETMQAGLRKECQVQIMRNLSRFLTNTGTFIPQSITLDIYLEHHKAVGETEEVPPDEFVGNAYQVQFLSVADPGVTKYMSTVIQKDDHLLLKTSIGIYNDVILEEHQSGLTTPITLDRFEADGVVDLNFEYQEGRQPGLLYSSTYPDNPGANPLKVSKNC